MRIFAVSNNERPHRHAKTQRGQLKGKTVREEKSNGNPQRVKQGFGNRLNEAIKPLSFGE